MKTTRARPFLAVVLALSLPFSATADEASPAPGSTTEGGSRIMSLASGQFHSCALRADGSAACWGNNENGKAPATVPGPFIALAAGDLHTCGLKSNGSLACWGSSEFGQFGSDAQRAGPYVAIAAYRRHTCGLEADGGILCWGSDNPEGVSVSKPGPYIAVSTAWDHSCGLKADGNVACWGDNSSGQAPALRTGPYVAISAGNLHTCGLKADGSAECWGNNNQGAAPAQLPGPYLALSGGGYFTCGLQVGGNVDCWGEGSYGRTQDQIGPFVAISTGHTHACGLKGDGTVACWGAGSPGYDGSFAFGQATPPADLVEVGFGQIAAGNAHACQVRRDGTLACWGQDTYGSAATGAATPPAGEFSQVVAGDSHGCAIGADGKVACWGRNGSLNNTSLQAGLWRQLAPRHSGSICALRSDVSYISGYCTRDPETELGGGGYTVLSDDIRNITPDYASGRNDMFCGVHADGTGECYTNSNLPAIVPGLWQRLESGLLHQCGLRADGGIECWGNNDFGQHNNAPLAADEFRAFSVGYNHACAIRENGQLYCWGNNINGQATPPAGTFVQVAAGNTFSCAIRSDGVRLCWGDDTHGQAPQLSLSPEVIADGLVGTAHAGASFVLTDVGQHADGDYVPPSPGFAVVEGELPPGLSLSASGLLSGTPSAGGSFSFTVEGEDANGFVANRNYAITIVADVTGPEIGYLLDPADPDGDNGWHVGDVEIDWTVTDAQSPITSSTGCEATTLDSDTLGASYTCSASSAGGTSSLTTPTLKRDATPPVLAPSVPSPLLRGHSYSASANATDATSGVATSNCGALDTSTLGTRSTTCTAADNAGNSNAVTLNYTVTTTCSNDGYTGTQLNWCRNICEMGYTGSTLNMWIRRWVDRFHDQPYCLMAPQSALR